jgi:hypothetical protein
VVVRPFDAIADLDIAARDGADFEYTWDDFADVQAFLHLAGAADRAAGSRLPEP